MNVGAAAAADTEPGKQIVYNSRKTRTSKINKTMKKHVTKQQFNFEYVTKTFVASLIMPSASSSFGPLMDTWSRAFKTPSFSKLRNL